MTLLIVAVNNRSGHKVSCKFNCIEVASSSYMYVWI